jgi:hypothetical protein
MGAAAIPLIIAGGVLQANSAYQQGQNASRMATVAAGQLENNARLADISANNAKGASQVKAQESLRQNRLLQSRQIAIAAASGGSVNEKSVQDTIARTAGKGRLAADVDLYEGDLRSMDYMNQAIGLRNKAAVTLYEGRQARKAGNIGAISSLIGTGATAGSFYGKYGSKAPGDTGVSSGLYE